jgi:hypothetical protein
MGLFEMVRTERLIRSPILPRRDIFRSSHDEDCADATVSFRTYRYQTQILFAGIFDLQLRFSFFSAIDEFCPISRRGRRWYRIASSEMTQPDKRHLEVCPATKLHANNWDTIH